MKLNADTLLPISLGLVPVLIVMALAGFLMISASPSGPGQGPTTVPPFQNQTSLVPPSVSHQPNPGGTSTTQAASAGGGGLGICLPLVGCV